MGKIITRIVVGGAFAVVGMANAIIGVSIIVGDANINIHK